VHDVVNHVVMIDVVNVVHVVVVPPMRVTVMSRRCWRHGIGLLGDGRRRRGWYHRSRWRRGRTGAGAEKRQHAGNGN
jgi:hypothetical protein